MTDVNALNEATMLYREPTTDSDEQSIQDIWGKQLETRVVDAEQVRELIAEGWVMHPADIGKSPDEAAQAAPVPRNEVLAMREELEKVREHEGVLADELLTAKGEIKDLQAEKTALLAQIDELTKALEEATAPKSETVTEGKSTLSVKPK